MEIHELSTPVLLKLCSFVFWFNLYLWTCRSAPKQSPEWCARIVTLLHGTVATVAGIWQCDLRNLNSARVAALLPWHYALMLWSWGYFAFDLTWCLLYWRDKYVVLCHHTFALLGITLYMEKKNSGCTFACYLALMEVTNPLLQTRWFLKKEGHSKSLLFYLVELTYLTMFVAIRGVAGTYLMGMIVGSEHYALDEKIICGLMYLVNISFLYDILSYAYYKYKGRIMSNQERVPHRRLHEI